MLHFKTSASVNCWIIISLIILLISFFLIIQFECTKEKHEPQTIFLTDIIKRIIINENPGKYFKGKIKTTSNTLAPEIKGSQEIVNGGSIILQVKPADTSNQLLVSLKKTHGDYLFLCYEELEEGYFLIDLKDTSIFDVLSSKKTIQNYIFTKLKKDAPTYLKDSNTTLSSDLPIYFLIITFSELIAPSFTLELATLNGLGVSQIANYNITINRTAQSSDFLQFGLNWFDLVDMDLHVETPNGGDIFYDCRTGQNNGTLDLDSNPNCYYDYINNEHVTWLDNLPAEGLYIVRVDLYSACYQPGPFPYVLTFNRGDHTSVYEGSFLFTDQSYGGAFSGREVIRYYFFDCNEKQPITFAARNWNAINSGDNLEEPGPNYYSDSKCNVWVDNGELHLRVTNRNGKWQCASVVSQDVFGYGRYEFYISSQPDYLDKNLVFGLFTYDSDPNVCLSDANCEIDIEFSKWGESYPLRENALYSVQPTQTYCKKPYYDSYDQRKYKFRVYLLGDFSTHIFNWQPEKVEFASHHGHSTNNILINQWSFDVNDQAGKKGCDCGKGIFSNEVRIPKPSNKTKVMMNLWLYDYIDDDISDPPSDGNEYEVVIHDFKYIPSPICPRRTD